MTQLKNLTEANFLAVCDVVIDIINEQQLTNENSVTIPLLPHIVKYRILMPADGINFRDAYCEYRLKALQYLLSNNSIQDYELLSDERIHRWFQKVKITVDQNSFKKFYDEVCRLYGERHDSNPLIEIDKNKRYGEFEELIKREKEIAQSIEIDTDYRLKRDQWLNTKRILDAISKLLSPLEGGQQKISLNIGGLPIEQRDLWASLLGHMIKFFVIDYPQNDSTIVATSEPYRKALRGENLIFKNRYEFEDYRKKISELYRFIEENGKKRFAGVYSGYKSIEEIKRDALMTALKEMPSKPSKDVGTPPPPKSKDMLIFWEDSGDIEYKNEAGEVRKGTKGFALLKILCNQKNTPISIEHVKKECNPLINKSEHYFRKEKDIDDTIRAIKYKLKVTKRAYLPIVKRGNKNDRKWMWIEK